MTYRDYKLLEQLLGELRTEIGKNICIVPNYLQDGFYLGTYDGSGNNDGHFSGPTIEHIVEEVRKKNSQSLDKQ